MVDINKPWHVKVTKESYEIVNKWWQLTYSDNTYINGICGMYLNNAGKLFIGKTEGPISGPWGTFGRLLTLNEFKTYILKEKNRIYELW